MMLALSGTQASAKVFTFVTPVNSVSAGNPVDTKATFNVTAGSMVVTLINLQSNILNVGQNISALFFTVDNGGSILSLAPTDLSGSSGTEVTIGTGGAVSGVQAVSPITQWTAGSSAGQSYLNDLAGGNTIHTVIGPATGGSYATVDTSIAGNVTNNPFIQNQATFTITNAGLLSTTNLSGVSMGFGTTPGNVLGMVPEPGSLLLVAIGMVAGALNRKIRRPAQDSLR